jgi:hypothetical protein
VQSAPRRTDEIGPRRAFVWSPLCAAWRLAKRRPQRNPGPDCRGRVVPLGTAFRPLAKSTTQSRAGRFLIHVGGAPLNGGAEAQTGRAPGRGRHPGLRHQPNHEDRSGGHHHGCTAHGVDGSVRHGRPLAAVMRRLGRESGSYQASIGTTLFSRRPSGSKQTSTGNWGRQWRGGETPCQGD